MILHRDNWQILSIGLDLPAVIQQMISDHRDGIGAELR
jgi:hypothetical protein